MCRSDNYLLQLWRSTGLWSCQSCCATAIATGVPCKCVLVTAEAVHSTIFQDVDAFIKSLTIYAVNSSKCRH